MWATVLCSHAAHVIARAARRDASILATCSYPSDDFQSLGLHKIFAFQRNSHTRLLKAWHGLNKSSFYTNFIARSLGKYDEGEGPVTRVPHRPTHEKRMTVNA